MKPGIGMRPPSSITFVDGPKRAATPASLPTNAMRPARTATVCATLRFASMCTTLLPRSTTSAGVVSDPPPQPTAMAAANPASSSPPIVLLNFMAVPV